MLFFSPYRYRGQLYSIIYGQAIPSVIGQKSVALTEDAIDGYDLWLENWGAGAETLELAGEDYDSRDIVDYDVFEE